MRPHDRPHLPIDLLAAAHGHYTRLGAPGKRRKLVGSRGARGGGSSGGSGIFRGRPAK